jgi:hypothetical protein
VRARADFARPVATSRLTPVVVAGAPKVPQS